MTSLPYPGILTDKERANFDSGISRPPLNYIYFSFNPTLYKKSKIIGTIPKGGMLYGLTSIRVLEPFSRQVYKLEFGLAPSTNNIGHVEVNRAGVSVNTVFVGTTQPIYLNPLDQERDIKMSLLSLVSEVDIIPTSGTGFGIMT